MDLAILSGMFKYQGDTEKWENLTVTSESQTDNEMFHFGVKAVMLTEIKRAPSRHQQNQHAFIHKLNLKLEEAQTQVALQAKRTWANHNAPSWPAVIVLAVSGEWWTWRIVYKQAAQGMQAEPDDDDDDNVETDLDKEPEDDIQPGDILHNDRRALHHSTIELAQEDQVQSKAYQTKEEINQHTSNWSRILRFGTKPSNQAMQFIVETIGSLFLAT
jgi:hypothetical protein